MTKKSQNLSRATVAISVVIFLGLWVGYKFRPTAFYPDASPDVQEKIIEHVMRSLSETDTNLAADRLAKKVAQGNYTASPEDIENLCYQVWPMAASGDIHKVRFFNVYMNTDVSIWLKFPIEDPQLKHKVLMVIIYEDIYANKNGIVHFTNNAL